MGTPQPPPSQRRIPARKGHVDRTLSGTLSLSPKVKDQLPPGAALFVWAKRFDAKTGGPIGATIVAIADHKPVFPYKFKLDESNAMGSEPFTGTVVLEVRIDSDRNASSRQKGDIVGRLKVKVPNLKLELLLDTVLSQDVKVGGM